jgi:hypothetical protein
MPPISVTARHVAQVGQVEGRLAHHQHQAAALLERDVGGAGQQVVAETVRHGRQRLHRAGRHHHGRGVEAAAGDAGADVAVRMAWSASASSPPVQPQFVVHVEHARPA